MIAKADKNSLLHIIRHMRIADREEIFSTRWNDDAEQLASECMMFEQSYVHSKDGRPCAAFGVIEIWPKVWSVWMFATDCYTIWDGLCVLREFRREIIPSILKDGAHRMQCDSLSTHQASHQMIMRFGASHESTMCAYGSGGQSYYRFAWSRSALIENCFNLHNRTEKSINSA